MACEFNQESCSDCELDFCPTDVREAKDRMKELELEVIRTKKVIDESFRNHNDAVNRLHDYEIKNRVKLNYKLDFLII